MESTEKKTILAGTSPRIKRSCEVSDALMNTGAFSKIGVQPHIMLSDVTKHSYIQSDNRELRYNNSDKFINIKPCQVQLNDLFKGDPLISYCHISKCGNKRCKTCDILGTSSNFTSSLTNNARLVMLFMVLLVLTVDLSMLVKLKDN